MIEDALKMARGNRARAARLLQATRRIVNYKIKQYGIDWQAGIRRTSRRVPEVRTRSVPDCTSRLKAVNKRVRGLAVARSGGVKRKWLVHFGFAESHRRDGNRSRLCSMARACGTRQNMSLPSVLSVR